MVNKWDMKNNKNMKKVHKVAMRTVLQTLTQCSAQGSHYQLWLFAGTDRPGGILGVSWYKLYTNIAQAPHASNKKQLSFYYVILVYQN